jgi:hypothetical protein
VTVSVDYELRFEFQLFYSGKDLVSALRHVYDKAIVSSIFVYDEYVVLKGRHKKCFDSQ